MIDTLIIIGTILFLIGVILTPYSYYKVFYKKNNKHEKVEYTGHEQAWVKNEEKLYK